METGQDTQMRKHWNYATNWKKISLAMENKAYVEVIVGAYAVLEDRANAILRNYDAELEKSHIEKKSSITKKLNVIYSSKGLDKYLDKRIDYELIDTLLKWVDERNQVIHWMAEKKFKTSELKDIAERGILLARKLINISQGYKENKLKRNEDTYYYLQIKKANSAKEYRQMPINNDDRITLMVGKKKLFEIKRVNDEIFMTNLTDEEIPTRDIAIKE